MTPDDIVIAELIDEAQLSLDELAKACAVEPAWLVVRVQSGLLGQESVPANEQRFTSAELVRARRLLAIERDFDANAELAALVVDLIEEVQWLRARVR
ncbi:MAG: MerR family transcriptional regulator [Burkholderiales bacterium]|nr:MerR family transcriptional regulator [Burkholderiales bacterium]